MRGQTDIFNSTTLEQLLPEQAKLESPKMRVTIRSALLYF